jgi:putative ABC transport system permease protein
MLKTYFTLAFRNFFRNKVFSLINVLGLSIGICAALVIFLIVHFDFTFDKFEKNPDRIYRVVTQINFLGSPIHNPGVTSPLPSVVKKEVSGLDDVVGFHEYSGDPRVQVPVSQGEKPFIVKHQKAVILADAAYFNLVPYQWMAGSVQTALNGPFKVVLTVSRAKIYFPSLTYSAMVGKTLVYDDSITCTVSGIVEDLKENSDFIFKEFISQPTLYSPKLVKHYSVDNWGSTNGGSQLLLRLSAGVSPGNIAAQINRIEKKYDKSTRTSSTTIYRLQPLDDIHFSQIYTTFGDRSAHKPTLYGLLAVAAFLLILASINFINLSTAQSVHRAKEIGVRKTLGSSAGQLIFQFLTETFFISCISLVCSFLLIPVLLKVFSDFIPSGLHFDLFHQPYLIIFSVLLTLLVTLLAGFYPAVILSRFKPVLVLKNQAFTHTTKTRRALLRKSLTISQFLIAQVFTMATLIAVKQIQYVSNKDMGFKKDAIILVETPWSGVGEKNPDNRRLLLRDRINKLSGVQMASLGGGAPAEDGWNSNDMVYKDGKKEIETDVRQKYGDTNYLTLYHIPLLAGRKLSVSDTANEYVINETYMHILGFQNPGEVLNKQINKIPIVGVMADFNQESLHTPVKPLAFSSALDNSWLLHIALKTGGDAQASNWKTTIAAIEKDFSETFPAEDFSYSFLDQDIAKFYQSEQNLSSLLKWASGLAIFISCMGLLGLVMYTTTQRTKEIGIRKVLGASISHIVSILSRDFVRLVVIASFIATPLAWWAMMKWLNNFAYRAPISGWVFVWSTLFMLIVALLTLGIQTIRAASANPVNSLRSE